MKILSEERARNIYGKKLPRFADIIWNVKTPRVNDIERTLSGTLSTVRSLRKLPKGSSIAITAGSRGIGQYVAILGTSGKILRGMGFNPFIVPAMGSHGEGTPAGRRNILKGMGITEETCGMPVRCGEKYIKIGETERGISVFTDAEAVSADGVLIFNRVKFHTDFESAHESGMVKMMVVGLGGPRGASEIHSFGVDGLKKDLIRSAKKVLSKVPVIAGLAVVENSIGEPAIIKAFDASCIIEGDAELLRQSKKLQAHLPVKKLDLLVVDRMGKEISGTGMDTHVIGRRVIQFEPEPVSPKITRIAVLDLTKQSKGNAAGLGLADIITSRLFNKINFDAFYFNAITSTFIERGKIPIIARNDYEAFQLGMMSSWVKYPAKARIIRIKDTLSLRKLTVSEEVYRSIAGGKSVSKIGGFYRLKFDVRGNLVE